MVGRKTRKLLSAHHVLRSQSDVDRLYLPKFAGERRLQTVEEEMRALNTLTAAQNT